MPEYGYSNDAATWSNAYLWPPVLRVLKRVAPPVRSIFELGCGNGATARMLAAEGYSVTGVDPSTSGIAIARRHERDGLRFEVGSTADDLAGKFGRFPVVISLEVIEHCSFAREFMRSFASLLAPGGVGLISTPYHGYLKNLAVGCVRRVRPALRSAMGRRTPEVLHGSEAASTLRGDRLQPA
jgi:2-polyprenyl-3-methyl-5-hydroxy-6-metoxy-1,4-benzoquinol methylase